MKALAFSPTAARNTHLFFDVQNFVRTSFSLGINLFSSRLDVAHFFYSQQLEESEDPARLTNFCVRWWSELSQLWLTLLFGQTGYVMYPGQ